MTRVSPTPLICPVCRRTLYRRRMIQGVERHKLPDHSAGREDRHCRGSKLFVRVEKDQ